MVSKIDAVARGKVHIRHRYILALDLAVRVAELEPRHVLDAGYFQPGAARHDYLHIHWRSAAGAAARRAVADRAAIGAGVAVRGELLLRRFTSLVRRLRTVVVHGN